MPTATRKRRAAEQQPCVKRPRCPTGTIRDYKKLELLGQGANGQVFKGRHRCTGKKVALKWIRGRPDDLAVAREAGCHAACRGHPSIVDILDVTTDADADSVVLVMELVGGGTTLRDMLWRPRPEDVARVTMRQLLAAAKWMHAAGVIHRDIKPENVFVSEYAALKIGDFGSATRVRPAGEPQEECGVGTMIYTSPEQMEGNLCYGQAVDMWAIGCIMAEILAGETLFVGETEEGMDEELARLRDQLASTGKLEQEFFEELSEDGRDLLTGLLAFNPDERLTAAEALEHRWFDKLPSYMLQSEQKQSALAVSPCSIS